MSLPVTPGVDGASPPGRRDWAIVEATVLKSPGGTASMSNTPNCGPTARRATGEPDPIFAAIERHRAALRGWLAAYDRLGVLQEMIPEARRTLADISMKGRTIAPTRRNGLAPSDGHGAGRTFRTWGYSGGEPARTISSP